jgi:hypothetical protein
MNAAFLSSTQNQLIISNGLVAYWSFNDGASNVARDFSGNKNDATFGSGTQPTWEIGKAGGAIGFTSQSYTLIPTNHTLPLGNTPRTLAAWVYIPNTSDYTILLEYGDEATTYGRGGWYIIGSGAPYVGVAGSQAIETTGATAFSLGSSIDLNTWTHIAATIGGTIGSATFYKNGVAIAGGNGGGPSQGLNTLIGPTRQMNVVGSPQTTFYAHGNNRIEDFRIYNRILSVSEILTIYNATNLQ